MLLLRPNSIIQTNVFGKIWTLHKSLSSSYINARGQTPRFHTPGFVQRLVANLDEHRKATSMFQQTIEYDTQMTNILFKLFDLEIKISIL